MRTTVYLDVLVLLNVFVTWFLFLATAKLCTVKPNRWRLLAGCLLGGAYSLLILIDLSAAMLAAVKLAMGMSLVLTVFFQRKKWRLFLKTALWFLVVNFIFAGFMFALWIFVSPAGMAYHNGVAYFNISALTLALSTIAAYLVITLVTNLLNRRNRREELAELVLELSGRQVMLRGFVDTGNKLTDVFTGLPVLVAEYGAVEPLFPERVRGFFRSPGNFSFDGIEDSRWRTMLRVVPVSTASGEGSLPAFRPGIVRVNGHEKQAIVAVTEKPLSDGSFQALLHTNLLN